MTATSLGRMLESHPDVALVVTVVVSLVTKAPAAEIIAEYEKVDAE